MHCDPQDEAKILVYSSSHIYDAKPLMVARQVAVTTPTVPD